MVFKLFLAFCLMAVCVIIHTAGVTRALSWLRRFARPGLRRWPGTRLLIGLAASAFFKWGIGAIIAVVVLGATFYAVRGRYLAPLALAMNLSSIAFLPVEVGALLVLGGMAVGCLGGLVAARLTQS